MSRFQHVEHQMIEEWDDSPFKMQCKYWGTLRVRVRIYLFWVFLYTNTTSCHACLLSLRGRGEEKDRGRWCPLWTWPSSTGQTTRTWSLWTPGRPPGRKVRHERRATNEDLPTPTQVFLKAVSLSVTNVKYKIKVDWRFHWTVSVTLLVWWRNFFANGRI